MPTKLDATLPMEERICGMASVASLLILLTSVAVSLRVWMALSRLTA